MSEQDPGAGIDALRAELARIGPLVVAFSGGADSAFLAWVATDTLGTDLVHCVTAVSPSLAPEELADCRALAAEWGLRHLEVQTDELADPAYSANDGSRCYHCKTSLLDALAALDPSASTRCAATRRTAADRAGGRRRPPSPSGVNLDDLGDHRPGQQAAAERGAVFPLVDGRVHQGRRAGGVQGPRPADLGQAGGGLPGLEGSLRHPGHPGYAPLGGRRRISAAGAGLPAAPGPPLRRDGPHRGPSRGPGRRGGPAGGGERGGAPGRVPLCDPRPRRVPLGQSQRGPGTGGIGIGTGGRGRIGHRRRRP